MDLPTKLLLDIGSVVSMAMSLFIARRSIRAFSLTGRPYLINFSAGFLLLGISYLVAIVLGLLLPPFSGLRAWPRLVVESLAFGLIASSYYTKERRGNFALLVGLAAVAVVAIALPPFFQPFAGNSYVGYIHLLEMVLVTYTLIQIARSYSNKVVEGSVYVMWGFGTLMLSQYTWVIWSYDNIFLTAATAASLRLIALVLLAYSLRK